LYVAERLHLFSGDLDFALLAASHDCPAFEYPLDLVTPNWLRIC
jgi:hypothetical protein